MIEVLENKTKKEQIRETAAELFKERGYSATSMRALAAALNIEPASLYSHIKSKEEILEDICFGMASQFFKAIQPIKEPDPETKLKALILAHIQVIIENRNAAAVFFHDWKQLSDDAKFRFVEMRKLYENEFKKVLELGMEMKVFKQNDIHFLLLTLFSAMNMTHEWYKKDGKWQSEEIGNKLADVLINGITI